MEASYGSGLAARFDGYRASSFLKPTPADRRHGDELHAATVGPADVTAGHRNCR